MNKNIIIIGMGENLSLGIAEKFGKEGFAIGMISRTAEKLKTLQDHLAQLGIRSEFEVADVSNSRQMLDALAKLQSKMGVITILQYNAVDFRTGHILSETIETLTNGFKISVANALMATQFLLTDLKSSKGAILLTGGMASHYPNPEVASASLGKAGLKSLASQLHQVLKKDGVYVGLLTISGWIQAMDEKYSPKRLAEEFWTMYQDKNQAEVLY
ncbi:SDR family NAD(P)-dependent oxidoreductase [Aureispira anguillae]|uniref:SDR family NAD(P)-dependent oxidoreductase n=1 Tax=Aureispira anguillae TaxID=2864201 RepID=A0A915YBY0_9BACT|nr:SDR family NAD(P)-dependent oxidoreductase [Aureispira anguillae]BDS10267.1 SDR family NAD(P)-dependent oxidoreductase [Aureispira anguillae]